MPTALLSLPSGSAAPIENSPPGIQTIPSGADPGAAPVLTTVGRNVDAGGGGVPTGAGDGRTGFDRAAISASATTTATAPTASGIHEPRVRRCFDLRFARPMVTSCARRLPTGRSCGLVNYLDRKSVV